MNREIKFRAISTHSGKWVYGNFIHSKRFAGCSNEFRIHNQESGFESDVISETVGQLRYTKNGKEYYDGDVYYHAGYGNEFVSELCQLQYALLTGNDYDIESVIGNIHENPELLKS